MDKLFELQSRTGTTLLLVTHDARPGGPLCAGGSTSPTDG